MATGGATTKRAKRETRPEPSSAGARPEAPANDETARPARSELGSLLAKLPLPFPLTNLDRPVYPHPRTTKGQLLAYFDAVAERMLPHIADRPLTLVRCPDGVGQPCFFQKHVSAGTPAIVDHVSIIE